MFISDQPEDLDVIDKALGFSFAEYYKEFTRVIVFLKGDKIVHYENDVSNIEKMINGQVIFDYPDSMRY